MFGAHLHACDQHQMPPSVLSAMNDRMATRALLADAAVLLLHAKVGKLTNYSPGPDVVSS